MEKVEEMIKQFDGCGYFEGQVDLHIKDLKKIKANMRTQMGLKRVNWLRAPSVHLMSQCQQGTLRRGRPPNVTRPCIPSTHGEPLWEDLADKRRLRCESGACHKRTEPNRVRGLKSIWGCRCRKCCTVGGVKICKSCCFNTTKHDAAFANASKPLKNINPRNRENLLFSGSVPHVSGSKSAPFVASSQAP